MTVAGTCRGWVGAPADAQFFDKPTKESPVRRAAILENRDGC